MEKWEGLYFNCLSHLTRDYLQMFIRVNKTDLLRMEVWQHDTRSTHPEGTQQLVNDAMNMVKWQNVEDDIIT